jgi:hypothetical protein
MISRHWLQELRARSAEPSRRWILESTVSVCHRCPSFLWSNRCVIRRRHRPAGGFSEGRPRSGGIRVRMPEDRTCSCTRSPSKSASANSVPIRARPTAASSAARNRTRSDAGPRPGPAARTKGVRPAVTGTPSGYSA